MPPANRLASTKSPYLRGAAEQPVAWLPWGEEAFEKARAEDKPILLDIGAVWCHWCHVMDHESYEDGRIASIINHNFVPVKVDRDERPDIDARYQKAVAAITGQGGWPLTAFLTSDGEPFFGGTYFPPEGRHGRPGFPQVLAAVSDFWRKERAKVVEQTAQIRETLLRHAKANPGEIGDDAVDLCIRSILQNLDPEHGGFGRAPKFPHPGAHELLLARYRRTRDPSLWNALDATLTGMGQGGVYDQLAGGFHRYSVDERWVVPHFEKMLYDNAELLKNYAHAHALKNEPYPLQKAVHIAQFVEEVLTDPKGGFRGSQDADVGPHDDGDFFTWTVEEAKAVLTEDEFHVASLHYGIEARGEMHHDPRRNVLHVAAPLGAIAQALQRGEEDLRAVLERAKGKLLEARLKREAPFVDPTLYANWNGMMIGALLDLSGVTGDPRYRALALKSLDRFLAHAYAPEKGFAHTLSDEGPGLYGLLDDNVQMADALLNAFNHTQDPRYLEAATATGRLLVDRFRDAESGGLRDHAPGIHATGGVPTLDMPEHPAMDQPTPAPNAVAVLVLDRLARLTGDSSWARAAEGILKAFAGDARRNGLFASTFLLGMELHLHPAPDVVVAGPVGNPHVRALHHSVFCAYAPNVTVRVVDPAAPPPGLPEEVITRLGAVRPGEAVAFVCEGMRCSLPLTDPEALCERLNKPEG